MDRITFACTSKSFFINVIALNNLTDCAANKTSDVSTTAGNQIGGPATSQRFVLNQDAVKLWRTRYPEQHMANLITEASQMQPCPASADTTNVTAGSDGLCCAAAGDLLETSGILADSLEFANTGTYPADWTMKLINAMASAPVAATGLGQYLLLLPAVEALESLRGYVADNTTCSAQLDAFHESLMAPYMDSIFTTAVKGAAIAPDQDGKQEAVLAKLVAPPLLMHAAMPDGEMSANVTGGKRRRTLLQDAAAPTVAADPTEAAPPTAADTPAAAPAPITAADAPAVNATTTPTAPAPAAGPTTTTTAAAPAPSTVAPTGSSLSATLQTKLCTLLPSTPLWANYISGNKTTTATASVSADLLPAVYGVAAAMPDACSTVVETAYASTQLADSGMSDVAAGVRYALMRCWLYDKSYSEAHRCLHALPNAQDPSLFFNLKPTSLRIDELVDFSVRLALLNGLKTPWLVATIAKASPAAWSMIAQQLSEGDLWDELGTSYACNVMTIMGAPMNNGQFELMQGLLDGRAADCSPDMRTRAIGKMLQAKKVAASAASQICGYLSSLEA